MDEPLRCYRHPDEETRVQCSSCGRPICTRCMITSPVGMRCPECAGRKRGPARAASRAVSRGTPVVTIGLIVVNVLAFALERGGDQTSQAYQRGALVGSLVGDGEWWRLVTSGFLHATVAHIVLNMLGLWFLGSALELYVGPYRFAAIYFLGLLGGAAGALLDDRAERAGRRSVRGDLRAAGRPAGGAAEGRHLRPDTAAAGVAT